MTSAADHLARATHATPGPRWPTTATSRYSLACLGATLLGVVGMAPHLPHWLSGVLIIAFVGVAPGCALLAWVRPPAVTRMFLIPALGLMVVVVVTAAAATVGWWAPRGLWSIIALSCIWSVIPRLPSLVHDMVP